MGTMTCGVSHVRATGESQSEALGRRVSLASPIVYFAASHTPLRCYKDDDDDDEIERVLNQN